MGLHAPLYTEFPLFISKSIIYIHGIKKSDKTKKSLYPLEDIGFAGLRPLKNGKL
jgi:hypothetical protein